MSEGERKAGKRRWASPSRLALALAPLLAVVATAPGAGGERRQASSRRPAAEVAALIDQLLQVSDEVTYYSAAYVGFGSPFWPIDYTGPHAGANEAKSTQSSVLRQIVSCGADALPLLLAHLTDARETKSAFASANAFATFSDQYDYRYEDPKKRPKGVTTKEEDTRPQGLGGRGGYTLRVGDMCYAAVGQIVNRHLHAVNARPGFIVNSPLERPALAAAVRQDWSGLTREAHEQSLTDDVLYDNRYKWSAARDALERLCFYYPAAAEKLTLKLLARPVDDTYPANRFIEEKLLKADRSGSWRPLIERFEAAEGQDYDSMVVRRLVIYYAVDPFDESVGAPPRSQKKRARAVLKRVYPRIDPYRPPFARVTDSSDLRAFIYAVAPLRSEKIDQAVYSLLRSLPAPGQGRLSADYGDGLTLACLDRLAGKHWDNELVARIGARIRELEAQIRELEPRKRAPFEERRLARLQQDLADFRQREGKIHKTQ